MTGSEPDGPGAPAPGSAPPLPPLNYAFAARAEAATRGPGAWSARHLGGCWIALTAGGALLAVAGGVVGGSRPVWGVLLGTVIVGLFFTASSVVISRVGRRNPAQLMWAALATYVAKVVALGVVLVLIPRDGALDTRWLAASVGLGVVVWLGAHLRHVWTTKIFYVDPS